MDCNSLLSSPPSTTHRLRSPPPPPQPPTPNPAGITRKRFTEILARYPAIITAVSAANSVPKTVGPNAPKGAQTPLRDLDAWRLGTVQGAVAEREPPFLSKDEAEMLLACKMRRGKRRAGLPKLLAANSSELIQATTASAFARLAGDPAPSSETILGALKVLVDAIKGVGPATASYILALAAPAAVPVFSDEGYRWAMYTNAGRGNDGWYREIKYDLKEYRVYLDSVTALAARLGEGVTAQDVEKVGFVLGKEAAAELTGGTIGGESAAAAKARIVGSKKLTGAEALDTALGVVVVDANTGTPAAVQSPERDIPGPAALVPVVPTRGTPTGGKRKKPDSDVETDDAPLPRSRKARVAAPKKGGRKMGWAFTGKK